MGKIFKRYKKQDESPTPTPVQTKSEKPPVAPTHNENTSEANSEDEVNKQGFFGLAKNLATSLLAWQRSGRPVVSSQQWDERIRICRGCEYWQELGTTNVARCKKCGCSSGKLLLATSKCPLNPPKWTSV